ncbi:MAG: D-alanine--D-alanine ligase [Flavobacteriales bacterium]|nr:D-alanine--D-alanine ligase [Flavobacteriales bacterium]
MNIAIVGGGFSDEYDISIKSQETVYNNLDQNKFKRFKVIIELDRWYYLSPEGLKVDIDKSDFSVQIGEQKVRFDCIFNVIHGTPGEDGKLQAYWDLLNIPYTSCNQLTSALTFSKDVCKVQVSEIATQQAKSLTLSSHKPIPRQEIIDQIGIPCFVKPNNGGSSVGASKVESTDQLDSAIQKGFEVDDELIIEQYLQGQEITCGVTYFNGEVKSLAVTSIHSQSNFFDYAAKYEDDTTQEITPAKIDRDIYDLCMEQSAQIYKLLKCHGTIRVDYMVVDGDLYFIEVNTIPGLSDRSLIPQQAAYCGIDISNLFADHIEVAVSKKRTN